MQEHPDTYVVQYVLEFTCMLNIANCTHGELWFKLIVSHRKTKWKKIFANCYIVKLQRAGVPCWSSCQKWAFC